MTTDPNDLDMKIGAMLKALAEAISEELPEAGFVLIMGRSADDHTSGSLLSLSNLDDDNTTSVLEAILVRRRGGQSMVIPSPTLQ
jgi:hypothetical protein